MKAEFRMGAVGVGSCRDATPFNFEGWEAARTE